MKISYLKIVNGEYELRQVEVNDPKLQKEVKQNGRTNN